MHLRIAVAFLFPVIIYSASAQTNCVNLDAELGDFTNWICKTGSNDPPVAVSDLGQVNGRHTIMSGSGIDPNGCTPIPVVHNGTYSFRVGNDDDDSEAESMEMQLTIDASNALIVMSVAAIMENPGHDIEDQPRMEVGAYDQHGNLIDPGCGYYLIIAGQNIMGFQTCAGGDIQSLDWTDFAIDLSAYIDSTVTIRVTTADCSRGGHYGYGYFEARCLPAS